MVGGGLGAGSGGVGLSDVKAPQRGPPPSSRDAAREEAARTLLYRSLLFKQQGKSLYTYISFTLSLSLSLILVYNTTPQHSTKHTEREALRRHRST